MSSTSAMKVSAVTGPTLGTVVSRLARASCYPQTPRCRPTRLRPVRLSLHHGPSRMKRVTTHRRDPLNAGFLPAEGRWFGYGNSR